MEQNNQVEANPELVINNLLNRIAQLEKDNAILMAIHQQAKENGNDE